MWRKRLNNLLKAPTHSLPVQAVRYGLSGGMAFVSLGGKDFSEIGISCHSEGGNFGRQKFYVTQKADFSIGRASVSLGSGAACGG